MANTNVQTAANDREFTSSVQFLTVTAIFVALTYIFTAFINVRLPIAPVFLPKMIAPMNSGTLPRWMSPPFAAIGRRTMMNAVKM